MTSQPCNLETRINALKAVLTNNKHQQAVETALRDASGDIPTAFENLQKTLPKAALQKITLAHSLADWSDDNIPLVTALTEHPDVNNLRDLALHFNVESLTALVNPEVVPETFTRATNDEKKHSFAIALRQKLFAAEPTAVLQRMVQDAEIPIADTTVKTGVANFLNNQPDFNIHTTSVYKALQNTEAFTGIAEENRAGVVEQLKTLQRVQALSPIPEAVPVLINANLTSAFQVAEMPESTFLSAHGQILGEETARQVYTNAINNRIRNEQALITMREAVRGTGLAIIDGEQPLETRMAMMQAVANQQAFPLNLEELFGSMDFCECEECTSVYSPASYFVELLQFLRNSNLDPKDPTDPSKTNPNIHLGIKDTPLEKLFRRRPDLGCLELTCDNTFTVLPYIDLVNEVMESFVVHLGEYHVDTNVPKQAKLETFNIEDETTSELLAQPQHINYEAYCILKNAVYPFTLPYHQPIDAIRIFLKYLGTSRYELLDVYRSADEKCTNSSLTPIQQDELKKLHDTVLDRVVDAEFLGLTQEEYIILTKEAFWSKRYFDITLKKTHTEHEYQHNIGVKPVHDYYGYKTQQDMLSMDETQKLGLTFVKKQFLRRTGIQYVDLVELLKTQFINPNYPQGKALTILESLRFSYRFLQTLVDPDKTKSLQLRFAKLIQFLETFQPFVPLLDAMLHPDPCQQQKLNWCLNTKDLRRWVYCYFEKIGQLIVLESGEGPQLPLEGQLFIKPPQQEPTSASISPPEVSRPRPLSENELFVGTLRKDGTIVDKDGETVIGIVSATFGILRKDNTVVDLSGTRIGTVANDKAIGDNVPVLVAGPVKTKTPDGKSFAEKYGDEFQLVKDRSDGISVRINQQGMLQVQVDTVEVQPLVLWQPTPDTCNLDKVRLTHLDGTVLRVDEYDRIHRFIRLWRKMGWTIDETDKALVGLSTHPTGTNGGTPPNPDNCDYVGFDAFIDVDCSSMSHSGDDSDCNNDTDSTDDWNCPDIPQLTYEITPDFLHQLVAVRKLLDQTGLPLPKLLTFWANISTVGEKSLYSRLFLTHNLLGIDKVFKADADGNYLTQLAKITDHLPVLMAALNLKADDITAIMGFHPLSDDLTLPNLSVLYRHSLLAKTLHIKVADLPDAIALFGDPFPSAWNTLSLLEIWGKMEDAGFTFRQLNYLIRDRDDILRPIAPTKRTILQITKTLYDGLNGIDRAHQDIPENNKEAATAELVRTKGGLFFEPSVVEQIIGLLEGTTVYSTNAPLNLTIDIPESQKTLAKKLKYSYHKDATPPSAGLQVTGILTDEERTQAKALSSNPEWAKAIDRISKQPKNIFNDALLGIFSKQNARETNSNLPATQCPPKPEENEAKIKLLAGDDGNTPLDKRFYFLQHFLPFLRQRLAHRLIVDTLAGAMSLLIDVTDVLLSNLLKVGTSDKSAIGILEEIKVRSAETTSNWKGYLIPPTDEAYAFVAKSETQPLPLMLDGESIPFKYQQEDPSNIWSTDPTPKKLKSGKLYWLEVSGQQPQDIQWKTATLAKANIPTSALLPDYSKESEVDKVFIKLFKAALLVNGFKLSVDEVTYWQTHADDFDQFNINTVTLKQWQRLQAYTELRNSLPKTETNLLDLFEWAAKPVDATKSGEKIATLSQKIADVTTWKPDNIEKLLKAEHFDLKSPEAFRNEVNLVKLQHALVVADKIAVDIDRLFEWAKPTSKFWVCHQIAEDIRKAIRARYDQEDWEKVVKPLNDQLRENQKLALISYLLVQEDLIKWGVVDADSLFEFFLIDVQMDACMETSRIKQAISSVQLFIQRCFLGLEDKYDVKNDALDRDRWEWMQRYRVWEANRKVFLYPENWIEPGLRDDKSPFYKELESELLQKDINTQTVQDALKSYLFKVDEVANLKVVGLFVEQQIDKDGKLLFDSNNPVYIKLHIFARTRNAPYFFYYRYFDITEKNWYPWEKVQVDIPSYDVEGVKEDNNKGKIIKNGTYLIPVVWDKRLLIFFPQFAKKTVAVELKPINPNAEIPVSKPKEGWEIKMAWSEYRNGKWTQKQLSAEAIYDIPDASLDVSPYEFIPRIVTGSEPKVVIEVFKDTWIKTATLPDDFPKAFHFTGSQIAKGNVLESHSISTDFHYTGTKISSLQAIDSATPNLYNNEPFFDVPQTKVMVKVDKNEQEFNFYHPFVPELLGKLMVGNLDALFYYYLNQVPDKADAFGADTKATYHELKGSYSLYNWEAAFHAPMQLVDRLLKSQQFEQALKMCHYVFNPLAKGTDSKRFWQFAPFKEVDAENVLANLFTGLQPGQPNDAINEWRDQPFQPHVIARSRPSAYMKWVVMKYIEILIAWGDYLFRQDTIETLNQATQLYVLAAHIYGPRGQKIPKLGKVQPQTYRSLLDKWDAFGNAMVELELAFPFSNQTPFLIGVSNGVVGLANVFGFATTLYFCIPDNPKLRGLRDTIDDRLFKIRHCQNIEGVFRKLPLFEPPIDPALLVQAAAQGLSLASVLNDLNSPMPNYRFYYLLQKALEVCAELKSMGNAFLSAKEKKDAEALSKLRAGHESTMHNLLMEVKKQQLEAATKSLEALQQSRKEPVYRLQHYLKLIGEDLGKVPDGNTDFGELPNQIEQPINESGLKLIQSEKDEIDKASAAADWQIGIGVVETLASVFHAFPNMTLAGHPLGVGADVKWGFPHLANATSAVARGLKIYSDNLSYQSSSAGRKAGFLRQLQDRVQQANAAGYQIKNIDKQALTQKIQINIANQEIINQQNNIDSAQEVEEFLRNKYTNEELYTWMEGQIQTLYYQAYTLAYELAKKAEKVFRFERGLTTSNFIQFGYWDAARDGLLAGERLYIGLKQLETAYQEKRGYDYEVTKHVSLRQINPMALIQLKEIGTCEFGLPEVLFDMDHPGHYMRRIKSVALTVPCVVGPYTSLNCTLRLLEHKFRTSAIAKDKNDYLEKTDETDDRFSTVNVPITSIAVSSGQNDSGVFELNFKDERYIPFEGAGVISKWRLELPKEFRQFDYNTISDAIVHIRYTALDGGDKLKKPANDSVMAYIKSVEELSRDEGLFAAFDLKHDFPNEWYKAMNLPAGSTERVLMLNNLNDRLPIFTKGRDPKQIQAIDVYLVTPTKLSASLMQDTEIIPFTDGSPVGETMKSFVIKDNNLPMNSWQLKIQDVKTEIDRLWLLVRYVLK
ncbi:neuraminidase-like domain-containing protein [Microcoleus sp. T3_A4]|uniref:Tc toxin subunit A-related protein n=1 Tax=Microcoleus sp. T3_A4 TaxID=2818968 RepID=UPI002FD3ECBC